MQSGIKKLSDTTASVSLLFMMIIVFIHIIGRDLLLFSSDLISVAIYLSTFSICFAFGVLMVLFLLRLLWVFEFVTNPAA